MKGENIMSHYSDCYYEANKEKIEQEAKATKEIIQISERVNVFIDTNIRCKKWSGKVTNTRDIISLEERIKWLEEDYVTGKGR